MIASVWSAVSVHALTGSPVTFALFVAGCATLAYALWLWHTPARSKPRGGGEHVDLSGIETIVNPSVVQLDAWRRDHDAVERVG